MLLVITAAINVALPPADWPDGVSFAGAFTDHAVLQRAPQRAAVYGVVVSSSCNLTSSLAVQLSLWREAHTPMYPIRAQHIELVNCSYARWKAMLLPMPAGGSYELRAAVADTASAAAVLKDVTFGDVWFCSGQSNMWLPTHYTFSRNATYKALRRGKYQTIRMFTAPRNAMDDHANADLWIAPPPPPMQPYGASEGGGWVLPSVGTYPCHYNSSAATPGGTCGPARNSDEYFGNTVDQFSATCWYFGQSLHDLQEAAGEEPTPLGLIHSAWGGTMVEMWMPNATLNSGACTYADGSPYAPSKLQRWDIAAAALYNGMVAPFVNTTITGALWYQGENNLFQCVGGRDAPMSDPDACGTAARHSGYGCFLQAMMGSWRTVWASAPLSNTSALFPIGVASLAAGTSEGFTANMPAFRLSQTGGSGLLPSKEWPATFVAQLYDAGDPGDGAVSTANLHDGAGAYSSARGAAPFTSYFMGAIHPRPKEIVGMRLARAARHVAYGDADIAWTGPVLSACELHGAQLRLEFDASLLRGDSLAVRRSPLRTPWPLDQVAQRSPEALAALLSIGTDALYTSPLEVQYGGTNLHDGLWLSATLGTKCADGGVTNAPGGHVTGNKPCGVSATGQPIDDFNVAVAQLPLGAYNTSAITAVRYAFRDNPCCPGLDSAAVPCPVAACPLQSYNATLPAVPFVAQVSSGRCSWISTRAGAGAGGPTRLVEVAATRL